MITIVVRILSELAITALGKNINDHIIVKQISADIS